MGILGIPGVARRDLVTVYPVRFTPGADPEMDRPTLQAGTGFLVISQEIPSSQAYREGRQDQSVNFRLHADWRRGTPYPVDRNDTLWHPAVSRRLEDGSMNLDTALEIYSVVGNAVDGTVTIECGRTE